MLKLRSMEDETMETMTMFLSHTKLLIEAVSIRLCFKAYSYIIKLHATSDWILLSEKSGFVKCTVRENNTIAPSFSMLMHE